MDTQEDAVLDVLNAPTTEALLAVGLTANFAALVPMGTLAVSTAPLSDAMGEIYRQAVADNIEQGFGETISAEQAEAAVSEHLATVDSFNQTTQNQVAEALAAAAVVKDEDGRDLNVARKILIASILIKAVFNKLRNLRKPLIVDAAVLGPYNQGLNDSAEAFARGNAQINKQWVTLKDERVRISHKELSGDIVPVGSPFFVNGVPIRFPKDPLAPPGLTINCRCVLKFTR